MHPVKHSDNFSRVRSVQKQYQESDTGRNISLSQYLVYTAHCENRNGLVYVSIFYQYFYRYTGILMVFRFASTKFFAWFQYRYDKNTFFSILYQCIAQLY